jgi:hypothetical protein
MRTGDSSLQKTIHEGAEAAQTTKNQGALQASKSRLSCASRQRESAREMRNGEKSKRQRLGLRQTKWCAYLLAKIRISCVIRTFDVLGRRTIVPQRREQPVAARSAACACRIEPAATARKWLPTRWTRYSRRASMMISMARLGNKSPVTASAGRSTSVRKRCGIKGTQFPL